jgi:hypothetical protein
LVGVEIDATCRKNSMKVTKRVKNITALWSLFLDIYSEGIIISKIYFR